MAPALKLWLGLTVGGCALVSLWTLPPSTYVRRTPTPRLHEEVRAAALRADVTRTASLIQRMRWMDSLPPLALATARDGIAVGAPPGSASSVLPTIRTLLRAELSDREQAGKDVTVGYFVQPPAFASEGDSRPGLRARQETYVGILDGAPYCIQLLVGPAPARLADVHTWKDLKGERHSDLARACRLVARHGLPGPTVTAWLRAGALRFAESSAPPPPLRGEAPELPGREAFGRRAGFWRDTDLGLRRCMAGEQEACADQILSPRQSALLEDLSDARATRALPSVLGGVYDPVQPPTLTQAATYLLGDLEREYGAERFGRFWRSRDGVARAFESAFGTSIGAWTASWVAAHVGTVSPGPALPRNASLGTQLALLVGALVAGAWHRRRGVGR